MSDCARTTYVSARATLADRPVRGSAMVECDICGALVWLSPGTALRRLTQPGDIWCLPCAAVTADDVVSVEPADPAEAATYVARRSKG